MPKVYKQKKYPLYKGIAQRSMVYGRAGHQLARDVAYLGTLINSEPKNFYVITSNNFFQDSNPISLSQIAQGDGYLNRDGNVVLPRYISTRITINKSLNASALDHETVRVMLFMYNGESTSSAPSVTQSEVLATIQNPLSTLNYNNTGSKGDRSRRIEVLRDEIKTLDKVSLTNIQIDWNIEINGMKVNNKQHMRFRSSSTEDPVSNGLYLLIMSDNSAASSYKGSYSLYNKLVFYDN